MLHDGLLVHTIPPGLSRSSLSHVHHRRCMLYVVGARAPSTLTRRLRMRALVAALVLLTLPTADWELLGTRRVSFTLDHDAIIVSPREGGFTAIKIEVLGGNLAMY